MKDSADLEGTDMDYVRLLPREMLERTTLLSLRHARTALAFEERVAATIKETMDELDDRVPAAMRERADRFMVAVGTAQIERAQLLGELVVALGPVIDIAMGLPSSDAAFEFAKVCDPDFPFTPDDLADLPPAIAEVCARIGLRLMREMPANISVFIRLIEPIATPIASRPAQGNAAHANAQDLIALLSRFVTQALYGLLDRCRQELAQAQKEALS